MQTEQQILDKSIAAARRVQTATGHLVLRTEGREEDIARIADDGIVTVINGLLELGANDAQAEKATRYAMELPLDAIAPGELEPLREVLLTARDWADKVDAKRRRVDPDGAGQDLGEHVRQLLARVELDLFGPTKRPARRAVTEGRE